MNQEYSFKQLNGIFNNILTPILILNEDFEITRVNKTLTDKYNYDKDQLLEHNIATIFKQHDLKKVRNELIFLLNKQKKKTYLPKVSISTGQKIKMEADLSIQLLEETGELLLIFSKNQQQELKKIKQNNNHTRTDDVLFLVKVDENGDFFYDSVDSTHQDLANLTDDQIKGKTPQELLGEKLGEVTVQRYQQCLDSKTSISYAEELNFPEGKRLWFTKLSPVIINEQVVKIIGFGQDITSKQNIFHLK